MSAAEPFPKGPYTVGMIGDVVRILDRNRNDVMTQPGGPERLVACANPLAKVFFPQAHVETTDEYIKRLEGLRKAAWARAQELEAELAALRPATPSEDRTAPEAA